MQTTIKRSKTNKNDKNLQYSCCHDRFIEIYTKVACDKVVQRVNKLAQSNEKALVVTIIQRHENTKMMSIKGKQ